MRSVLSRHRHHHAHRAHPRETSLSVITLAGGLIAFFTGVVHSGHFVAVCVGIVTFLFGLYSQLVSATTAERWINVIGIGLAFVGVGLGLSHGGFTL
jgi:CHASE2 domain-containing sensor protein